MQYYVILYFMTCWHARKEEKIQINGSGELKMPEDPNVGAMDEGMGVAQ